MELPGKGEDQQLSAVNGSRGTRSKMQMSCLLDYEFVAFTKFLLWQLSLTLVRP